MNKEFISSCKEILKKAKQKKKGKSNKCFWIFEKRTIFKQSIPDVLNLAPKLENWAEKLIDRLLLHLYWEKNSLGFKKLLNKHFFAWVRKKNKTILVWALCSFFTITKKRASLFIKLDLLIKATENLPRRKSIS